MTTFATTPTGVANGLLNNLVSYYKADTSGSFPDAHGSNNGTINGATYTASGKINGAYSFDGVNDYISVTDFNYNMTTSFTYNAWIYINNYSDYNGIIEQDSTANRGTLFRTNGTTGELNFIRLNSGGTVLTNLSSSSAVGTGAWKMVTATFDNTVGSKIYIDGVQVASDTVLTNTNDTTTPIIIGARENGTNNFMDGLIDEAGIWSRGLSATEISALYNNGAGLSYDSFTT